MRNWKQALLILSLAIGGMLVTNWVYPVRGAGDPAPHTCQLKTCSDVKASSSDCDSGVWCQCIGCTIKFWKCYPADAGTCTDDVSNGYISCAGTCQVKDGGPCFYTLDFCDK
jgi:hypothetical protein